VRIRQSLVNTVIAALVIVTAAITVGLTASANSSFTIKVTPVLMRLGVDLDVKLGTMHVHAGWTALPGSPVSTNAAPDRF